LHAIGSYLIYKLYRFSSQINFHGSATLTNSIGIHIISNAFDVTWIIMVRYRINLIAGSNKGNKLWLNPFITSIFHVINMPHKLNQDLVQSAI